MLRDEIAQKVRRRQLAALTEPTWDDVESWVLVRFDPREGQAFSGGEIASVYATPDAESGQQAVGFEIKAGIDAQRFAEWTDKNKGRSIVTMLDNQVQSIANIEGRIEGNGIIRGGAEGFTQEEITRLITVIRSGSLAIKPNLAQKFTQGPSLGEDSIKRGINALLVSFGIVPLFMLGYYRMNGLVAVLALVCNLMLLAACMSWVDATLTLPGIAGLVLTIGMAVDANILINERIREELEKGKTIAQAVKNGFDRAYVTIFDSNLTTFIAGVHPLPVRHRDHPRVRRHADDRRLATSMLTGVYFSRTCLRVAGCGAASRRLTMMRLFATPNFNFLEGPALLRRLRDRHPRRRRLFILPAGREVRHGLHRRLRGADPPARADGAAEVVSVLSLAAKAARRRLGRQRGRQGDAASRSRSSRPTSTRRPPRRSTRPRSRGGRRALRQRDRRPVRRQAGRRRDPGAQARPRRRARKVPAPAARLRR